MGASMVPSGQESGERFPLAAEKVVRLFPTHACREGAASLPSLALYVPIPMPKQKTKKAVVKRMKLTKSGKVKRSHAFTSHIMVRRTTKRKRQLRKDTLCAGKFEVNMRECLGGKRR